MFRGDENWRGIAEPQQTCAQLVRLVQNLLYVSAMAHPDMLTVKSNVLSISETRASPQSEPRAELHGPVSVTAPRTARPVRVCVRPIKVNCLKYSRSRQRPRVYGFIRFNVFYVFNLGATLLSSLALQRL